MIQLDFNNPSLFQEKKIIGYGPYSKTSLIVNEQTGKCFAKRFFIDVDQKALKKYQKSYNQLYGIRYPCSILPNIAESCLYTPYFENQSLKNVIQKIEKGDFIERIDITQKLIIIYGILYFLDAIHRNQKMHGRLMASNVLLDSNFNPYISDYCLYQINPINLFTKSNCRMIDYMVSIPPEVLTSNSMNTYCMKSDIYSFGIILLQILSQRINVYSDISNDSEKIKSLKTKGQKPKITEINKSKLENNLYDVINRCLEPKPNDRPSAHDIIKNIDNIIKNEQGYDKQRFQQFLSSLNAKSNDKNRIDNCYPKYSTEQNRKNESMKKSSSAPVKYNHISLKDDPFFKREKPAIKDIIDKVKEIKKLITKQVFSQDMLENKGFIFTNGAIKRLTKLYYYLEDGVPVLLEGPTGTSKTLSSEIVCKLCKREMKRFNLSSDTKSNYLLGRYIGDPKSWAGISMSVGPFVEAFKNGYTLLLDEINLASQECLQFIEEALDSHVISIEIPGMPLEEIAMHKDFRLIATQNPNKGSFSNKRYDLDNKFLSRFQVISFPSFEEDEYKEITKGLCKSFGYKASDTFIEDLVKFHTTWSSREDVKHDVQCFTVREIAATINALANRKITSDKTNEQIIYDTIMSIYGARYSKAQREVLKSEFLKFDSFKNCKPSKFQYPANFSPQCYTNKNLEEALKSIFFSFENNRNVILTGNDGCGISQIAKWVSQCYDENNVKRKNKNRYKTDQRYFCVCTEETKCSDLIGYQRPSKKIDTGKKIITWKSGFLTKAIEEGKCAVLDSLDEAPSTVAERLNVLLDEKYDGNIKYFEIPENPQGKPIEINPKFRLLCTCRINNINQMSPAFLNRFDVVVLENQLEDISEIDLKNLIKLLLKSNIEYKQSIKNIKFYDSDYDDSEEEDFSLEPEDEIPPSPIKRDKNPNNNVSKHKLTKPKTDSDSDFSLEEDDISTNNNKSSKYYTNKTDDDDSEADFSLEKEEKKIDDNEEDYEEEEEEEYEEEEEEEYEEEEYDEENELIELIYNAFDQSFSIYKLAQLCKSVSKFNTFFRNSEPKIEKNKIVNFTKDLIMFNEKSDQIQEIPKEIEDFLINHLDKSQSQDNLYFYEESPPLRSFIAKLFACSIINLHVCVYGPTGVGKTASARAFASMRKNKLSSRIPFLMHSFHIGTRPNNFFGSTTIKNGKVSFINGTLTKSLVNGYTFIADEMNLSSSSTMKAIAPALEPCIGEYIYIPGVSEPVAIHPDFFFIACQNEVGTIGRNVLSTSISSRLKTFYYPKHEENISTICLKIAKSFYNGNEKPSFTDDEARNIGTYMIKLNDEQKILPQWSLRDITKIFKRISYQDTHPDRYHNISLIHNILFYTLAPANKKDTDEILDTVLNIITEIYQCKDKKAELKKCYNSKPYIGPIQGKKGIFLKKGEIAISTSKLNLFEKYKHQFSELLSLLNSIFHVLLSDSAEPILLTGPSGFKTFLSKLFLDNGKIIALNQETTVSQLIGTSVFLSLSEAKFFYLDLLCKICHVYNDDTIKSLKDKIKNGKLQKSDITQITNSNKLDKSFNYAIDNLTNKLCNNSNDINTNFISDMIIEFGPGEILSAIFEGRSIIFKDISNLPTVVLERFNELFSCEHNLTINEDYHNTFTSSENKELKNFSSTFRAFATCQENTANKLSEAALSRFTVINVPSYKISELNSVLKSYNTIYKKNLPDDLTKTIIDFSHSANKHLNKTLSFTQMINILEICFRVKSSSSNDKNILGIVLYRIFGGLIEKRHKYKNKISTIFEENKLQVPEIARYQIVNSNEPNQKNVDAIPSTPFNITKKEGLDGLESKITGLFIPSTKIKEVQDDVEFTRQFIDMIDVIHLGIATNIPVILEGNPGQGKNTAIQLIAKYLDYNVVNIVISKSTKVNDLLGRVTIETDNDNQIHVKKIYTKLTKEIERKADINNKIFVFHNLNNASPAVLDKLSSLFDRNQSEFSLPDGTSIFKGRIHIIGIFNPQNGISNREKLPSSLIFSSIYHIVDDPRERDELNIIKTLFKSQKFKNDAQNFYDKYKRTKKFAIENSAIPPITLHDINKFIVFRSVTYNKFSRELIYQMLFGYRFLGQKTIDSILKELNLFDLSIYPSFIINKENNEVYIKESENLNGVHLKMHRKLDDEEIEDITTELKSLTLAQQQCFLFLACSILSKRTCIVQGTTASGKSHSIRLFAKMLGQKLNVYQMNKDTDISFLTGQSVLSDEITEADENEFKEAFKYLDDFKDLKAFIDNNILNKDKNEWNKDDFTDLLKKISKYEINHNLLSSKEKTNLKLAGTKIRQIMSPARRFIKKDSNFIQALVNGEWVLIDGIENAPPEIAEKLSSLCGDIQELDLFECGEDCYFSRTDPNSRKIHDNFHLFVTYNPSSKTTTKVLDPIFLNKCVSFTIPAIDSSINSSSRILIANLMKMKYDNDFAIDFGQRFAVAHQFAKEDSKTDRGSYAGDIQFNGRTLTFILKEFNRNYELHSGSLDDIDHTIYRALYLYYWNSYINKQNKKQFKTDMIKQLAEDPQQNSFIVDIQNIDPKKKYEVLLNYLRNIQLYACKMMKDDNIKLNDFFEKCGKVQLSDISFIVGHFIDTLNIIDKQISLGDERKNSLHENQYFLINILTNILKEIQEKKKELGSKYLNLPLISDDNILLSVEKIKKPIARLSLLCEISKTNYFCRHVPYILYDKYFVNILKKIVEMSIKPNLSNFNIFMSKLHENQHLISLIDEFFPYHLFNNKQYKMILYWMPIIRKLYDKKITFHIKIIRAQNEHVYDFIFPEYKNIEIIYVFKEESSLLISSGSIFFENSVSKERFFKSFNNNNNKITIPKTKTEDELENWNKKFYKCSSYLLKNTSTTIIQLKNELETDKLDLPEVSIHYPYLSKFYNENINNSLIYKELSIVFNFEKEIIEILANILHPVEADLLNLISHIFSNIDSYSIKEIVENVNAFSYFGDQKSKLWIILNNQYPSLNEINDIEKERDQIENELKNLKELPEFDEKIWPYKKYIEELQSKIEPLNKKILEKLEGNETKKVREQLKELRNKLENKPISNKECKFLREVIVNSINKISEESPTNENYNLCYTKVQQFISFISKNDTKYSPYIWPNYNQSKKINESHNIKIYENVIWFSRVKVLLDKICTQNTPSPTQ